ncbi:PLP-dependent transferase [Polyplosphaeria fusca]|uniref:PLP-dependent transferase n=1 Tax=Polyplosphaeria fusca TaxID=682080 RepID=A0A9P4V4Z7_9PLEO|nr:PLP-dependent transferase [Polyplosphaeria fusca]
MLSFRGQANANQLDVPWKFAQGTSYDPTTNPKGLISFATAENFLVQQELEDFTAKVNIPGAALGSYGYSTAGGGPRLPQALAVHLNEYFNPYKPLTGDDIKFTASATSLHHVFAFCFCGPGEGILTSRPYYGRFEIDFWNESGVHLVAADTYAETCFQTGVVQNFEKALLRSKAEGITIKALLITNPHNPLGRGYPKATLVALMKFCQTHQIHFISDEIYGLSVFESGESETNSFTSALSIDPAGIIDPDLVHVEYGLAKDFAAPGLRLGALVTKNRQLQKSLTAVIRFHSPSGVSVAVATAMLEDRQWCRWFIEQMRDRLAHAYKFATRKLRELGIRYLAGANAGMFLWIDLSPYLPQSDEISNAEREQALAQRFIDNGVFLQPGEEHALTPGWFRLVYTCKREVLEEGLSRVAATVKPAKVENYEST